MSASTRLVAVTLICLSQCGNAASAAETSQCSAGESVLIGGTSSEQDVYIITSRLRGSVPKIGPARHASVGYCPKGVSPIVYECGVPVTNMAECEFYGTQLLERGFKKEPKRYDVSATKVCGSPEAIKQRMLAHRQLNIPLLHDCRHHAIDVTQLRGKVFRLKLPMALK